MIIKIIKQFALLFLLFLLLHVSSMNSFGQQFNKTIIPTDTLNFFSAWGTKLTLVNNDTFLLVGPSSTLTPIVKRNILYAYFNSSGDDILKKIISYPDTSNATAVQGNTVMINDTTYCSVHSVVYDHYIGTTYQPIYKVHLVWLNKNFDTLFTKEFTANYWVLGFCMYKYSTGIIVCGVKKNSGIGEQIWVLNLDFNGNIKWQKLLGEAMREENGFSVCKAANNGYYVSALSDIVRGGLGGAISEGYTSIYRIDSNGNTIWKRKMYKNTFSFINRIRESSSENYYLTSYVDSFAESDDNVLVNCLVSKIDSSGSLKWEYMFNKIPQACQGIWDFQVLPNSDLILYGSLFGGAYNEDYGWVTRMDSSGNVKWQHLYKSFTNSGFGYISDAVQMNDGGFLLTGAARDSLTNKQAIWLLRVDSMGCLVSGCVPVGTTQYELSDLQHITMYPNPSNGNFAIRFFNPLRKKAICKAYNAHGQLVHTQLVNQGIYEVPIALPKLSGVYLIQLTDYTGMKLFAEKIQIE